MNIEIDNKYFHSELNDKTLVLYMNYCVFLEQETFKYRDQLLDFLDEVNKSDSVKVLVISNDHSDFNLENYKEKWNALYESKNYEGNILRVFRTYNQLLLKIKSIQKIVFSVNSKLANTMLFCLSMAADLRFVSRDFYIDNDNHNFVNIPKGGAIFIESSLMYVNPVKMLFLSDKVFSQDLYEKHIVDEIFNQEELMERILTIATRYSKFDYIELESVKMIEQSRSNKLELILQKENDYLLTCIRKKKNLSNPHDRNLIRIK
ncbi:hypothetical protein BZG02_04080 [Labilibaculum filiforme]|uniref:Enoyl-CoA hydratase n=1 Tax=Labilibaculum filiforme TaxID=1940526 RepID=A0A2N3I3Z6_9BACT|nr:hypothetical protein [Labilibaculum filiforme]PKQ65022.1 hypothetical protein BZG02_04080 [Labilibaculum filiforme]